MTSIVSLTPSLFTSSVLPLLANGTANVSSTVPVIDGTTAVTETPGDSLPSGVTFSNATVPGGVFSGTTTATAYGTYAVHLTATEGGVTQTRPFLLTVAQIPTGGTAPASGSATVDVDFASAFFTAANWSNDATGATQVPGIFGTVLTNHDIATVSPTFKIGNIPAVPTQTGWLGMNLNQSSTTGLAPLGTYSIGALSIIGPQMPIFYGNSSTSTATSAAGTIIFNGATVLSVPNVIFSMTGPASNAANNSLSIKAALNNGDAPMTISLGGTSSTIVIGSTSSILISANITEQTTGSSILVQGDSTGNGTLVLSGNNSFSGSLTVAGGTLQLAAPTLLSSPSNPLGTTAGGTVISGTGAALDLNGVSLANAEPLSLAGTGVSNSGALYNSNGIPATFVGPLTLTGNTTINSSGGDIVLTDNASVAGTGFNLTLGGVGQFSTFGGALATGSGSLTKTGSGTWDLTGPNLYTGATTVNSGTLLVDGSTAAGSAVTVVSGTLGGSGTISGAVSVTSGTVSPGSSTATGTLTAGSLSIGTGTLAFDVLGSQNSELVVNAPVNITNAGLSFTDVSFYTGTPGVPFTILQTTSLTGTFVDGTVPSNGAVLSTGGQLFLVHYTSTDVTLTLEAPPTFTFNSPATFNVGSASSFPITATGFPTPITIALTQTTGTNGNILSGLPAGLTFSSGVLSGTPAVGDGGSYTLTFTASNGVSPNTQGFLNLIIDEPVSFVTTTAYLGAGIDSTFVVQTLGYPRPNVSESDPLPTGVSYFSSTFAGTPQALSTTSVHLTASNGITSSTETLTLSVDPTFLVTSYNDGALYAVDARSGAVVDTIVRIPRQRQFHNPRWRGDRPRRRPIRRQSVQQSHLADQPRQQQHEPDHQPQLFSGTGPQGFVPSGLAFGPDGNLYVAENGGLASAPGGVWVFHMTSSGSGPLSYTGTNSEILSGLTEPAGLAFGVASGDTASLYVATQSSGGSSGKILKIPTATTTPGTVSTFYAPSGGATFQTSAGIEFGPDKDLYVVDMNQSGAGNVFRLTGSGSTGTLDTSYTSPASKLGVQFPSDVAFDDQGNLFTANRGGSSASPFLGSVYEFTSSGSFVNSLVASSQFASGINPSEIAFAEPAAFTTSTPTAFAVGTAGSVVLATGTPAPTLSVTSGGFPAGLTFTNGILSGTPTVGGQYLVTIMATNNIGAAVTESITIVVGAGPQSPVYVSSAFGGQFGSPINNADTNNTAATYGSNVFSTIASGLAVLKSNGTINVNGDNGGVFPESVSLTGTQILGIQNGAVTVNSLDTVLGTTIMLMQSTGLQIGDGDGLNHTIAGTIMGQGQLGLIKRGTDTLTLTGPATYSGPTTVSQGSLLVNTTFTATAITVTATGTLGGTGTLGTVTSPGIVNPGVPGTPGTLTAANLTLNGSGTNGTLLIDLVSPTSSDEVVVTSAADITGSTLSLTVGSNVVTGDQFTILKFGSLTGTFNNLPTTGSTFSVGGQTFSINYAGPNSTIVLTDVTPVSLNGGSPGLNGGLSYINNTAVSQQHSMVENIVYSFNSAVSLSTTNFALTGINGTPNGPTVALTSSGGGTVWTVTFTGTGVNTATNSIGDGEYDLALTGVPGLTNSSYDFFRLLGDMDGNGTVDSTDFSIFISSFLRGTADPAYLGADDLDGNNKIDSADFSEFESNFLHSLPNTSLLH